MFLLTNQTAESCTISGPKLFLEIGSVLLRDTALWPPTGHLLGVAFGNKGFRDRDDISNTADQDQLVYPLRLRAWLQSPERGQQQTATPAGCAPLHAGDRIS